MSPHWPSPLVAWILIGWTAASIVGTVVWWWLNRPTRDARAAEDAKAKAWEAQCDITASSKTWGRMLPEEDDQ